MSARILSVHKIELPENPIYGTEDLDHFQAILHDALAELRSCDSPLVAPEQESVTRIRIAAAIFKCADDGERDAFRLRRRAIASLV
jgi:hypothetical protein